MFKYKSPKVHDVEIGGAMLNIRIDCREAKVIERFTEMADISRPLRVEQLPVADMIIEDGNGASVVLLERKTFSDFTSSLTSGRYKEQRERLKSVRAADSTIQIAYIFEGFPKWHAKMKNDLPLQKRVYGAIENLIFVHGIAFISTNDVEHTCETLKHLAAKMVDGKASSTSSSSLSAPLPARKVTIKEHLFPSQLALIPGISNETAVSIAPLYGSTKALVMAIADDRDAVMSQLSLHAPKHRKLGKTKALAIIDAFS